MGCLGTDLRSCNASDADSVGRRSCFFQLLFSHAKTVYIRGEDEEKLWLSELAIVIMRKDHTLSGSDPGNDIADSRRSLHIDIPSSYHVLQQLIIAQILIILTG